MENSRILDTCDFCAEIHGIDCDRNLLNRIIGPQIGLQSRVMYRSDHFIVMPTIGAFVEGYVMAVSNAHYSCSAQIPEPELNELELLLTKIRRSIQNAYHTSSVCFEHGSVSCVNRFGGCIDHAHIHVVPCDVSLIERIEPYGLTITGIDSLVDLQRFSRGETPYLFFQDTDGQRYFITGPFIISQFFRQLLAQHYHLGDRWDWHQYPFLDNIEKTMAKMSIDL